MNQELVNVIKIYSTGPHTELSNYLIGKSKDTIIGIVKELLTSIWRFPPEQKNPHPAPFPLELPIRCIYSVMDGRKGVVIDPYCGSGTTLVASKILGCDYIGIEISDEYIKFAEERLRNYEKEIEIAMKEIEKHVVTKTFKERKEKGEFTGKYGPSKNKFDNSLEKEIRLF